MKKTIALLLVTVCLLSLAGACFAAAAPDFQEVTRLNDMQAKKQRGYRITKIEYQSYAYSMSPPHFETYNSQDIDRIWKAIRKIRTAYETSAGPTCVGSEIKFTFSDGTEYEIFFGSRNYHFNDRYYALYNAEDYWDLITYYSRHR